MFDQKVRFVLPNLDTFVSNRYRLLRIGESSAAPQFHNHRTLVNLLKKSISKLPMNLEGCTNDFLRDVLVFKIHGTLGCQGPRLTRQSPHPWALYPCFIRVNPCQSVSIRG